MAPEYRLTLTIADSGKKVSIGGRFEDEDWTRLEDFTQYVDDMFDTNFVRFRMPASLSLNWRQGTDVQISTKLPPWNDVIVFLHKFRPILLQSESANFHSICNILTKELTHPYVRSTVQWQREIYNGKRLRRQYQVLSDDVPLNSEKVLHDYLNAYEYHRDREKRAFIESLHTCLPLEVSKVFFLALLKEKTIASCNIASLIKVLLGKQETFEGLMRRPA